MQGSQTITNPILTGFNPDPSVVRVNGDYYIATSTFEWFPGVQIHHSRDLVHWRLLTRPLVRTSQLDLRGDPRSGGVWAPCLSHADGKFWLVYTDVKNWGEGFFDGHNYVVTAPHIEGPWSEPIYLNSSGFDPSLFHDVDGRKWLTNMLWDFRPSAPTRFAGIVLQEYSVSEQRLMGEARNIFKGSALGITEGPHLYRRGELYYLMVAEGGTGWDHAVTMARSASLQGSWELDPEGPMLTSRGNPGLALQKAGHASLVETQTGDHYVVHLCGRPLSARRRCILGRETALQKVRWTSDGWLRLENGTRSPAVHVPAPALPAHPFERDPVRDDFDRAPLGRQFQTLRVPASESWLSLSERPGFLRLYGRESPSSLHHQSVVGRRVQAFRCRAQTALDFAPSSFQQMAGLMAMYDDQNYYYLCLTHHELHGRCLALYTCVHGKLREQLEPPCAISAPGLVHLRVELDEERLMFSYALDGQSFAVVGPTLDATQLSDEGTTIGMGFTGAFFALVAQDLSGQSKPADFDYFEYEERP